MPRLLVMVPLGAEEVEALHLLEELRAVHVLEAEVGPLLLEEGELAPGRDGPADSEVRR